MNFKLDKNKIAHWLLALLIIILPVYLRISPFPVNLTRVSKDDLFTVMAIISCVLLSGIRTLSAVFYLALTAIPYLILNNYNVASNSPMTQIVYITSGICLALKFAQSFEEKYSTIILNSICVSVIVQCFFGGLESIGLEVIKWFYGTFFSNFKMVGIRPQSEEMYGTLYNPNIFAAFIAISMPAFFRENWFKHLVFVVFCLFSSLSAMGLACATVAVFSFVAMEYIQKKLKSFMFFTASAYVAFIYIDPWFVANGRWNILKTIFSYMSPMQKIFGTGAGWLWDAHIEINNTLYRQDHSEPFAVYRIAGIAGISLFVYLLYKALKYTDNRIFFAMLCTAAFNSMGNFTLHTSPTAILFLVSIAGCIATRDNGQH